jgi:DNA replication protein DnaC
VSDDDDQEAEILKRLKIPPALKIHGQEEAWRGGLLFGPVGAGKSHKAACRLLGAYRTHTRLQAARASESVGVRLWSAGRDPELGNPAARRPVGIFAGIPTLLMQLRSAMHNDGRPDDIRRPVLYSKFAVLDDLGSDRPTDWAREELYVIINHRWSNELETIVTSNLDLNGLAAVYGDRIVSRIVGFGTPEYVGGKDRRLR